jgi:hypothetical protein
VLAIYVVSHGLDVFLLLGTDGGATTGAWQTPGVAKGQRDRRQVGDEREATHDDKYEGHKSLPMRSSEILPRCSVANRFT